MAHPYASPYTRRVYDTVNAVCSAAIDAQRLAANAVESADGGEDRERAARTASADLVDCRQALERVGEMLDAARRQTEDAITVIAENR